MSLVSVTFSTASLFVLGLTLTTSLNATSRDRIIRSFDDGYPATIERDYDGQCWGGVCSYNRKTVTSFVCFANSSLSGEKFGVFDTQLPDPEVWYRKKLWSLAGYYSLAPHSKAFREGGSLVTNIGRGYKQELRYNVSSTGFYAKVPNDGYCRLNIRIRD